MKKEIKIRHAICLIGMIGTTGLIIGIIGLTRPTAPIIIINGESFEFHQSPMQDAEEGARKALKSGKFEAEGYRVIGKMLVPLTYAETGINSYMIGKSGIVYFKDWGGKEPVGEKLSSANGWCKW